MEFPHESIVIFHFPRIHVHVVVAEEEVQVVHRVEACVHLLVILRGLSVGCSGDGLFSASPGFAVLVIPCLGNAVEVLEKRPLEWIR